MTAQEPETICDGCATPLPEDQAEQCDGCGWTLCPQCRAKHECGAEETKGAA